MRTRHPFGASNAFYMAAIAVLVIVAAVFAGLYFNATHDSDSDAARLIGVAVGMDKPLPKALDPSFKDADGDLIADPPTDPSKFINPDTLVFSFVAENPEAYKVVWKDFTDHLAKVTGKKVEYSMTVGINEQLRDFAEGRLHVTGFNTGSVPLAVDLAGFVPVFTLGTQQTGGFLHMEIIVPADSPIQNVDDLRGHTITLVDFNSNSGCKAALVILKTKFNLLPERDYTIS
jgi:phosphonate transport system substrate-binding protein